MIVSNEMPLSAQDSRCQVSSAFFVEDVVVLVATHAAIGAKEQHGSARQDSMGFAVEEHQQYLQPPHLFVDEYAESDAT